MNVRQAILDRIKEHAPTAALLDQFGGVPAIFSPVKHPAYSWSEMPAVLIRNPTALDDLSSFRAPSTTTGQRSQALLSLSVIGLMPENSNDDSAIEDAAKSIRGLFRGKKWLAADGLHYQALASGPIAAPTDSAQMAGFLLQLRLNVGG